MQQLGAFAVLRLALVGLVLSSCAPKDQAAAEAASPDVLQTYSKAEVDARIAVAVAAAIAAANRQKPTPVLVYSQAEVDAALASLQAAFNTVWKTEHDAALTHASQDQGEQGENQKQIAALQAAVVQQAQQILALEASVTVLNVIGPPQPSTGDEKPPLNMAQVGDIWVDKYETSLWARQDTKPVDCAQVQAAVDAALASGAKLDEIYAGSDGPLCQNGKVNAVCLFKQYGNLPGCDKDADCPDYPGWFPNSGEASYLLYACSIKGVMPSRNMSWFQAVVACTASGKHLTTNAEWQAAAMGTPDLGKNGPVKCNLTSAKLAPTGANTECISTFGIQDMVGNLDEWVADWLPAGQTYMTLPDDQAQKPWPNCGDGEDTSVNLNGIAFTNDGQKWRTGLPAVALRGGNYSSAAGGGAYSINLRNGPTDWGIVHGARCARRLSKQ